ncbi:SID-1 A [Fasciolopsis buskii]|uniref:SID-1 A n=1 Tax=Fasciolopsis buskii TaxID=27845 RepID=A0A8E0RNV2_9TREM|nr:SID-1 A [Fasciolopsis buski]
MEYEFSLNDTSVQEYVIRVHVLNSQPQKNFPILIVIKQQQQVLSFEVPVVVNEVIKHANVSRTLCPIRVDPDDAAKLTIGISSFAPEPITYMVRAEWVRDFDLNLSETRGLQIYPAQPMLLRYRFTQSSDSVAVRIVSPDDVCMTFSLQPIQCPWDPGMRFGREQGPYQTVTSLGVISINVMSIKLQYEEGFFVLLTLEPTDYLCKGIEKLIPIPVGQYRRIEPNNRTKSVRITLQPTPNRKSKRCMYVLLIHELCFSISFAEFFRPYFNLQIMKIC